jgi:choline dehydrogenase-like flavoprotein
VKPTQILTTDVLIVGSGPGGGTLAYALRNSGASILIAEKGDYLPVEPQNWDPVENFVEQRYKADTRWTDDLTGTEFRPNLYQHVGGCSKVWGTVLARMRAEDFGEIAHQDGTSPAWPISYHEMSAYYTAAEHLFDVHGAISKDPTAPPGQPEPPRPYVGHAPTIEKIVASMARQGLHPYELPVGVDAGAGGGCVLCSTCDGFPCQVRAKNDVEMRAVRPALASKNVELRVNCRIDRLVCSDDGTRVATAVGMLEGAPVEIHAERFVLSAGAGLSASILLGSKDVNHPNGLANSSDQVGRNYMQHVFSALMAVDPLAKTDVGFQKTAGVNDFYLGSRHGYPLGNIQGLGKLSADMLKSSKTWVPMALLRFLESHSSDWWATTEDLPRPENRLTVDSHGRVHLRYQPNNVVAHRQLVHEGKRALRKAGFPLVFASRIPLSSTSAHCGTARFGEDPTTSVLDPQCRTHDIENLWVVDGAHMPSSSSMNPGLTIAAQALRVGDIGGIAA